MSKSFYIAVAVAFTFAIPDSVCAQESGQGQQNVLSPPAYIISEPKVDQPPTEIFQGRIRPARTLVRYRFCCARLCTQVILQRLMDRQTIGLAGFPGRGYGAGWGVPGIGRLTESPDSPATEPDSHWYWWRCVEHRWCGPSCERHGLSLGCL